MKTVYKEQKPMIHCILLAAGFSVRYGGNKLIVPINGKEMYRHTADILKRLSEEGICSFRIVTRPGMKLSYDATIIENMYAEEGIASSIRAGINSLPDDGGSAAFFVADQPFLQEKTIRDLLKKWPTCGGGILRCESGGIPGNPVIFDRKYFPELLALRGDTGGRQVIRAHPGDVALFTVNDRKEMTDLDERAFS